MLDLTNHNKFAGELIARLVNPFSETGFQTAATAAKVATQAGVTAMNMHQPDIARPISGVSPLLFQPAENTSAFLKSGFLGFQGSGKSMTASLLAIGLVLHMRKLNIEYASRPVFFLDTETGSDWVKPLFDEMGVALYSSKTRAFSDLIAAINEAQKSASFLITDSISHFWTELCESYRAARAKHLKTSTYKLQFQDWAYLKGPEGWGKFTNLYINSPLHMGVCGRAGFEYDFFEDDDGKKQLEKTGIKMKAEGEFGFEPSLLVQMTLHQQVEGKAVTKTWREANVIKDRSNLIDGKTFVFAGEDDEGTKFTNEQLINRTFKSFLPHISRLNLGGPQLGVNTARNSEHMVPSDKREWSSTHRKLVIAELEALLFDAFPGQTKDDKIGRAALTRKHFHDDEMTWARVEEVVTLSDLRAGYDSMYREVKGKPSQYAHLFDPVANSTGINDSLPEWDPLAKPSAVVTATIAAAETTPDPLAIPAYLVRSAVTAVEPLAAPAFDESKWLADVTKAFAECQDFDSFVLKQQTMIAPNRPPKVSEASWKKAVKIATACVARLAEQPGSAQAVAAE